MKQYLNFSTKAIALSIAFLIGGLFSLNAQVTATKAQAKTNYMRYKSLFDIKNN